MPRCISVSPACSCRRRPLAVNSTHVLNALARLEGMAVAGLPPDDMTREAELIAAGWWWDDRGDLAPDRLVLLVHELRR